MRHQQAPKSQRVNVLKNHAQITPKYNQYQAYSRRPSVQLETDRPGVKARAEQELKQEVTVGPSWAEPDRP